MQKQQIREQVIELRRALNLKLKTNLEFLILNNLKKWQPFINANNIALYHSTIHEVDTTDLIKYCLEANKKIFLPRLTDLNSLDFYNYNLLVPLIANKYKILEPAIENNTLIDLDKLDIIFCPLVAYTEKKQRLGVGGGYYDKTLSSLRNVDISLRPLVVGLAFHLQEVSKLPLDTWDFNLDYIITENGVV